MEVEVEVSSNEEVVLARSCESGLELNRLKQLQSQLVRALFLKHKLKQT
jgi:hypothetical protein